ncbi:MAG: hypothetical protein II336_16125 [Loktanella sp.]|nr:hypothetical protein [Loktanella sp.]
MKPIYHGFDGLEFAISATIPAKLNDSLAKLKESCQGHSQETYAGFNGVFIMVRETGARGGYAYSCREDTTGDWFFKKPSPNDPWGVRFSAASSALAILGLEGLRLRCAEVLAALGINAPVEAYHPSRVDFAVDFLAPDFTVCPDHFVIHSRTGLKSVDLIEELQVNGRSSRTTSVTVGKMPGRQCIIYDKREEVMVRCKHEWPAIWGRAINGPTAPPLDLSDRAASQIWRVELRVGKRHLKDVWDINSWASLYELLRRIFLKILDDIKYCQPCPDTNRSRWPSHAIWQAVREVVANDLFDALPTLSPEEYIEIKKAQKLDELATQTLGLTISMAAIDGCTVAEFEAFLAGLPMKLTKKADESHRSLAERLSDSGAKYRHLRD